MLRITAITLSLAILGITFDSHALPSGGYDPEASGRVERSVPVTQDRYSPGLALTLSLVPTLAGIIGGAATISVGAGTYDSEELSALGIAMFSAGFFVGPSIGHWYVGNHSHAWGSLGGRLGAVAGGGILATAFVVSIWSEGAEVTQNLTAWGSALCFATASGLAIWSIAAAPGAARRANREWSAIHSKGLALSVAPAVMRGDGQKNTFGLGLSGKF